MGGNIYSELDHSTSTISREGSHTKLPTVSLLETFSQLMFPFSSGPYFVSSLYTHTHTHTQLTSAF